MLKEFNVTGICLPKEHYMVDISGKLKLIGNLIEKGKYFTINRPRQYGKTTTIRTMGKQLRETGDYVVFNISFEGVGEEMFQNEKIFAPSFLEVLGDNAAIFAPEMRAWLVENAPKVSTMKMLSNAITEMVNTTPNKYDISPYNFRGQFVGDDKQLDMVTVLIKFQLFMREHNSVKNRDFLETHGRLMFMAFMKPIINGAGYDFKEPQVSDEKRLDVIITFYQYRYLAELKIWYGEVAHQKGLIQLSDYMDTLNLTEGYLVIFNHNKKKTWKSEWIHIGEKKIFAVWV